MSVSECVLLYVDSSLRSNVHRSNSSNSSSSSSSSNSKAKQTVIFSRQNTQGEGAYVWACASARKEDDKR